MDKRTPEQVWKLKKQRSLDVPHDYFIWVQDIRVVQKGCVRINNREYTSNILVAFNNKKIIVEYALNNDSFVKTFTKSGKFITQVELVKRKGFYLSQNLLDDRELIQKQAKIKRINNQLQEVDRQYMPLIDAQVNNLEQIGGLQIEREKSAKLIDLDLTT